MRLLMIVVMSGLLMGCSLLFPPKTPPVNLFVIDSMPYVATKQFPVYRRTILVTQPETPPVFNTNKMAYSEAPHQVKYFAKNRWAETPAEMLQPLMVQTLQKTHYFNAVSSNSASSVHYDYVLNTQILELQQLFYDDVESYIHFKLRAQLVNANGKVIATRLFFISKQTALDPRGGVIAANQAVAIVLGQLSGFCVNAIYHPYVVRQVDRRIHHKKLHK